jgi:hypothetical protein
LTESKATGMCCLEGPLLHLLFITFGTAVEGAFTHAHHHTSTCLADCWHNPNAHLPHTTSPGIPFAHLVSVTRCHPGVTPGRVHPTPVAALGTAAAAAAAVCQGLQ